MADGPAAADELRHRPGDDPTFVEVWSFVAEPGPSAPALDVQLGLRPALDDAWFTGRATLPDERVAVVAELHVGPVGAGGLELRTSGLWADHVVEEPLQRWSLGLEAFGIALPLAEAALVDLADPDLRGERVPVGWDLEWEHTAPPRWLVAPPGVHAYGAPSRVHGEVVVGHDAFELDVTGHRTHRWGPGAATLHAS